MAELPADSRPTGSAALTQGAPLAKQGPHPDKTGSYQPTAVEKVTTSLNEERPESSAKTLEGRIGRYDLIEEINHGGMGIVYKARDSVLGRLVALKTMRNDLRARSSELVSRFYREAKAVAHLSHPHIVPIFDYGEHEGEHYIAMEFMCGGSLSQHLDRYRSDPMLAAELVEKIARAIHYAHEQGILHRDLKPGNVLLDEQGEPHVSDFGLAKLKEGEVELTQPGVVIGTPAYMAPEQASGRSDRIGPATDIWALGGILFELLTGRRAFESNQSNEVVALIRGSDPPRPRSLCPRMDRALETIVLKCLEKDPDQRYPTASALADDLRNWRAGEPIVARPPPLTYRAARLVRRHPIVATASVCFAAFLISAPLLMKKSERQRDLDPPGERLEPIQQEMRQGKAVELVGDRGLPAWYRWRAGRSELNRQGSEFSPLVMRSWYVGLLELLPNPTWHRFRLRAEVRINQNAALGLGGIYIAYMERPAPDVTGSEQWWVSLTYSESIPTGTVKFELHRFRAESSGLPARHASTELCRRQLRPGIRRGGDWQRLCISASPIEFSALWEEQRIGTVAMHDLESRIAHLASLEPRNKVLVDFEELHKGGLGLYCQDADTSFRHVVVEPSE
jgi:serine/threonine protein kinase